jgi:hypothetical protein
LAAQNCAVVRTDRFYPAQHVSAAGSLMESSVEPVNTGR